MDIAERTLQLKTDFDAVYGAGKEARDDEWWDTYLAPMRNGNPTPYMFAGGCWNGTTFYPNQNIIPLENASNLFNRFSWNAQGVSRIDLAQRLEECGVVLDISAVTTSASMFEYAWITRVPSLNCNSTKYSGLTNVFSNAKYLVTIDELIIRNDGTNAFSNVFTGCTALKNITITGVIGRNISFADCPLTVESLKNIISCLKDYSETSSFTYTLTLKDSCKTELEADTETVEFNGQTYTYFELITAKGWNLA